MIEFLVVLLFVGVTGLVTWYVTVGHTLKPWRFKVIDYKIIKYPFAAHVVTVLDTRTNETFTDSIRVSVGGPFWARLWACEKAKHYSNRYEKIMERNRSKARWKGALSSMQKASEHDRLDP